MSEEDLDFHFYRGRHTDFSSTPHREISACTCGSKQLTQSPANNRYRITCIACGRSVSRMTARAAEDYWNGFSQVGLVTQYDIEQALKNVIMAVKNQHQDVLSASDELFDSINKAESLLAKLNTKRGAR